MNSPEFRNLTHPSFKLLRKHSLLYSRTLDHTLTNDEFMDNVLVAISLFLLVILLKDIITRIVYMRPRFSVARNTITYFSQARILLLDNSFLLRWVQQFRLFDTGPYMQRNHMQYNLVMLATLTMFMVEFGVVVPGLPTNKPMYRDSDEMVRWESQYLDEGRIMFLGDERCIIAPFLEGPNLKSESSWSYCLDSIPVLARFSDVAVDRLLMTVTNPETVKGFILVLLYGEEFIVTSRLMIYIPVQGAATAKVGLSDNATTFLRNLHRNFDLVRNVTGLTWTQLPDRNVTFFSFRVNASQVKLVKQSASEDKTISASHWINGIIQGILTLRAQFPGSQLYEVPGVAVGPNKFAVPLNKTKILVGSYIGTLVPVFYIVTFTADTVLLFVFVCIFLRSPPGGAWELLEAHRRNHGDRILAGPSGNEIDVREKGNNREDVLQRNEEHVHSIDCGKNILQVENDLSRFPVKKHGSYREQRQVVPHVISFVIPSPFGHVSD